MDFSNLNRNKLDLNAHGESGDTFRAILNYAKRWRPKVVILENLFNSPWELIKASWESHANYSAEFVKADTKEYYLPQTRQRGYMICIDHEATNHASRYANEWIKLMKGLERLNSSSVEHFMLRNDDIRVLRAREEMAKDIRGDDKAPREVDWTKCRGRHLDYRANHSLGTKRLYTGWENNGSCSMPDFAWSDWSRGQGERVWDSLDMSHLRSARRGFDSRYKCRVWELSQNIDRFTDSTPFGIANCVTPTGIPYVSTRGGPMIGLESLACQGLPIDKLLLTRESGKQLQDLAGNAMSSTVIGAAIMAALIVGHQVLDCQICTIAQLEPKQRVAMNGHEELIVQQVNLGECAPTPIDDILALAQRSRRLCLCEGDTTINTRCILSCSLCQHSACTKCAGNPPYEYAFLDPEILKNRLPPSSLESHIKNALPMRMALLGIDAYELKRVCGGFHDEIGEKQCKEFQDSVLFAVCPNLQFHRVWRAETCTVFYESSACRLELALYNKFAEWRAFFKPPRNAAGNDPIRKLAVRPFARMRPAGSNFLAGTWELCIPVSRKFEVKIEAIVPPSGGVSHSDRQTLSEGFGDSISGGILRSWESNLGLQEPNFADKKLWSKFHLRANEEAIKSLDADITGEYKLLPKCGTAFGCLHKKIDLPESDPVFFFLDPSRIGDPAQDTFVFSTEKQRLELGETRPTIARTTAGWRPSSSQQSRIVSCTGEGL